jgi:pyruvate,orthophosphate dikinase
MSTQHVVEFDNAPADRVDLLGGKGAGLTQMAADGVPVPPGFVLTTQCGRHYLENNRMPDGLEDEIRLALGRLGDRVGRRFGDVAKPLLVSVRSGAPVSMPGMMDTVLNVGLTEDSVRTLAQETGDSYFAFSCFERLLDGFARTVRGISAGVIEETIGPPSREHTAEDLLHRCQNLLAIIKSESDTPFPAPEDQLTEAVAAVFRSWNSRRAKAYRTHRNISDDLCTAIVVQAMVFGNRGTDSGSGVAFTRDPANGAAGTCGEFLLRAQGEDVVSGEYEPGSLNDLRKHLPRAAAELDQVLTALERRARDMCDVEFTVENGRLWVLQTRVGQRSGRAEVRIAVDMVGEGLITRDEAIERVEQRGLESVAIPRFANEPSADDVLARGIPSSPGAAVGIAVFDATRAQELAETGEKIVLIRPTTSPADLPGLLASVGVVTGRGGPMSHAAVVARGLDRPAVCGVGEVSVAPHMRSATVAGQVVQEGTVISVDGDRGILSRGALELVPAEEEPAYRQVLLWRQPV